MANLALVQYCLSPLRYQTYAILGAMLYLQILKGTPVIEGRPGASIPPVDFDKLKADLVEKHGDVIRDTDVMSAALYPKVFDEYAEFVAKYGPVDKLDTRSFLAGPEIDEEINVSLRHLSQL